MKVTSLLAAVASYTGKICKNRFRVFERGQNLLQNGVLNRQESRSKVRLVKKPPFEKGLGSEKVNSNRKTKEEKKVKR